jgi:two-component system, OmpR family, response regulator
MIRVLLVDDDVELSGMLREYLVGEGFATNAVNNGEAGIEEALSGNYDLAIIDIMMPGISGLEALARIRLKSQLPILMLTAKGDDIDRIIGLEMGADDYVPKPSTPRELVARIRAILRRIQVRDESTEKDIVVGSLVLRSHLRTANLEEESLQLTSTEFNLLEVLARNAGKVVSKHDLAEQGMARSLERFDRSIDVHVSSMRKKLGVRTDGLPWIQTVRGQGYQLTKE